MGELLEKFKFRFQSSGCHQSPARKTICGDYTPHRLFGLRQQNRTLQGVCQIGTAPQGIASFATDEHGEMYIVGYEGMIYQLDLAGTNFDDEMKTAGMPVPAPSASKVDQR